MGYLDSGSNRDALRHWCLRPARLPIPPSRLLQAILLQIGCKGTMIFSITQKFDDFIFAKNIILPSLLFLYLLGCNCTPSDVMRGNCQRNLWQMPMISVANANDICGKCQRNVRQMPRMSVAFAVQGVDICSKASYFVSSSGSLGMAPFCVHTKALTFTARS